jgi:hypothetical protein
MAKCSPPKGQAVKAHTRSNPRALKRAAAKRRASLPYAVRNTRTGQIVSRHRTLTAAIRQERRLDLQSFRRGNGRPYDAGKA